MDDNPTLPDDYAHYSMHVAGDLTPDVMGDFDLQLHEFARDYFSRQRVQGTFVGIWNTGCNRVTWQQQGSFGNYPIHIVDAEDPGRTLTVEPGQSADFRGTIIP